MNFLKKNEELIFNALIAVIGITMLFRQLCTYVIIVFVLFNVINYKSLSYSKIKWRYIVLIMLPFLLDILFLWNNDTLVLGLKMAEKRLSLFIIPFFIIGFNKKLHFTKILKVYSVLTTLIVSFFISRFLINNPDLFFKYLKGIELWEMGYRISHAVGDMHAPALNMHLAFVGGIHFYFLLTSYKQHKITKALFFNIFLLIISLLTVLVVNTRMAIFILFLSYLIIGLNLLMDKTFLKKKVKFVLSFFLVIGIVFCFFANKFPYVKTKFSDGVFKNIEKIGRVDEIENAITQTGTLVFRLSMWSAAIDLSQDNLIFGVGASRGKNELVKHYSKTGQNILAKNKFPVHNQFLDFLLKFGLLGLFVVIVFMFNIGYLAWFTKNPILISFFVLFLLSNLTDDFLIRFDGIVFSGLWVSVFSKFIVDNNNSV